MAQSNDTSWRAEYFSFRTSPIILFEARAGSRKRSVIVLECSQTSISFCVWKEKAAPMSVQGNWLFRHRWLSAQALGYDGSTRQTVWDPKPAHLAVPIKQGSLCVSPVDWWRAICAAPKLAFYLFWARSWWLAPIGCVCCIRLVLCMQPHWAPLLHDCLIQSLGTCQSLRHWPSNQHVLFLHRLYWWTPRFRRNDLANANLQGSAAEFHGLSFFLGDINSKQCMQRFMCTHGHHNLQATSLDSFCNRIEKIWQFQYWQRGSAGNTGDLSFELRFEVTT